MAESSSTFDLSAYEIKETEVDTESTKVTGSKLYHKQFTKEESAVMESEKSVKRPRSNETSSSSSSTNNNTVSDAPNKKRKTAVALKDVDPTLFKFGSVYKLKNGNRNRPTAYGDNEPIKTPWLFASFPPKDFGSKIDNKTEKLTPPNWSHQASFIGVDENWSVGQPYPKGEEETAESIERHLAFAKTKEIDTHFIDNVYANSLSIFDMEKPRAIIEKKYSPIATRNYNENDEDIRYSPSLKVSLVDGNIPVFRVNSFDEPLPEVPNSSVEEFSKLPYRKKGDANPPKYWVKYMIEIAKQNFSKQKDKPLVSHTIKCHGIIYIDKATASFGNNFNDVSF